MDSYYTSAHVRYAAAWSRDGPTDYFAGTGQLRAQVTAHCYFIACPMSFDRVCGHLEHPGSIPGHDFAASYANVTLRRARQERQVEYGKME